MTRADEVLSRLRELADPRRLEGMRRFGVGTDGALGVTVTELRALARTLGRDHDLAAGLWGTGIHEARLLATIVDDPALVTRDQAETWVLDVGSWDLCDGLAGNLLDRTPFAVDLALAWSAREELYVRRAGFALMAWMAVHRKDLPDERFRAFLPVVRERAVDERNHVKKAVSWALRQIGKRSGTLHPEALALAEELRSSDSRPARWIGSDAARELGSEAVRARLGLD